MGTEGFCNGYHDDDQMWFTSNCTVRITDFGHSRVCLPNGEVISNHKDSFHTIFNKMADVRKLFLEFSSLKITEWGEYHDIEQYNWKHLLRFINESDDVAIDVPLRKILRHPFFNTLKVAEEDQGNI